MRRLIPFVLALVITLPVSAQESWILLEEYDAPGNYAHGLYYAGKLLYHVDWDTATGESKIYTLNPYNLAPIDSVPSPVESPWGITHDTHVFWLSTHGSWGSPISYLAKMLPDTFLVDTAFAFDGYYFHGVTHDSVGGHLWVAAMDQSYTKYVLEFDGETGEVVEWHPGLWWGNEFATGMQYWDEHIWANATDFQYPDHTYKVRIDTTWNLEDTYIYSYVDADGIATNGVVWWLSFWRFGNHVIQKVLPPGVTYHDIAAHSPVDPLPGSISIAPFFPIFNFINYGSVSEIGVLFVLRITETAGGTQVCYRDTFYMDEIVPEEIVAIEYDLVDVLEPNTDYTFTFYCDLEWDQIRANDTMRVYVHTEGAHDLAILSVLEPDTTEPYTAIEPAIIVQNQGQFFEPVAPVHLEIEHPNGDLTLDDGGVYDLDVNEIDTIQFSMFDPPTMGDYTFTFDGQLAYDVNPANDLVARQCLIGLVHDVAPVEITCPLEFMPCEPFSPSAVIANLGDLDEESFYVDCTIEDSISQVYYERIFCPPLAINGQEELVFSSYNPPNPAHYTCRFETQLILDNVPGNDTLSIYSSVGIIHDVAPTDILAPDLLMVPEPFRPTVIVSNLGSLPSDGFYTSCLIDSGSISYYYLEGWVEPLEPGECDTVEFSNVYLTEAGLYRFLFVTDWEFDDVQENDSLEIWSELVLNAVSEDSAKPSHFQVESVFPNPLNAEVAFRIHLPKPEIVNLELYNLKGRKIASYALGLRESGVHQAKLHLAEFTSGIYLVYIQAGDWHETIKVALLK